MNTEVKELWIKALESGEYNQTRGKLKSVYGGHCCLGVLCDVYHKTTGLGKWIQELLDVDHGNLFKVSEDAISSSVLPEHVWKWAGLDNSNPRIDGCTLANYNDVQFKSFKEIAELIKTNL